MNIKNLAISHMDHGKTKIEAPDLSIPALLDLLEDDQSIDFSIPIPYNARPTMSF